MSEIGGALSLIDAPIDRRLPGRIGDGLNGFGTDGGSEWVLPDIAMIHRRFDTSPESRWEVQPLVSATGETLCWDGRLDNRDELRAKLHSPLPKEIPDAEIALAAYRRWGIDFLERLIGDYALALWDENAGRLILARDPCGPRPLFYYTNSRTLVWASRLSVLMNLPSVNLEVEDEYVASYLSRELSPELTPYKGFHGLAPGSCLIARRGAGEFQIRKFWKLDLQREIRYKTDREYEEQFRHLFREAVKCRLRVDGPVWAQLSGGLDSSSIVCMADEVLESGEASATRLETVSYVYDEARTSDEREFIQTVEAKRARPGILIREDDYPALGSFPDLTRLEFPDYLDCFADRHQALCLAMRDDNARVLLTGHGGDELLCATGNPAPALADLLRRGRLITLHESLKQWSAFLKRPYLDLFVKEAVCSLLPESLRARWAIKPDLRLPPWYDTEFAIRMNLSDRNLPWHLANYADPIARDQAIGFEAASRTAARASYRSHGIIEVSHPFLHRPLVEFLQAIPFDQRLRPNETRSVLRRSLKGLLPEKILRRKTKGGPDEAFLIAIGREWHRLLPILRESRACARGYLDSKRFMTAMERARHGCQMYRVALILSLSLEFWLRSLECKPETAQGTVVNSVSDRFRAVV